MGNERFDPRFDARSSTSVVQGRRAGDEYVKPIPLGITDVLRKLQSNRKSHRIGGPGAQVLRDLATAADLVPELTMEDKRAFLVTEFNSQMPDETYRLLKLFGIREKPLEYFMLIVGEPERVELFDRARELSAIGKESTV